MGGTMTADSPFKPGARVAIQKRHGEGYTEAFVEKSYKNGNFTLKGSIQQWKPSAPWGTQPWRAHRTGRDIWDRSYLMHWNEQTDAEIAAATNLAKRRIRKDKLLSRLGHMDPDILTDTMLDQIAAALGEK